MQYVTSVPPSGSHKIWAILCHVSAFFGAPLLLPLVVYLAMRGDSEYVTANAREALNFHLSLLLYTICGFVLMLIVIGIPLLILLGLVAAVLAVIAAIKASDGGCYRYPMSIRFIR